jgi:peptidoglycan hydrolase CwlO-like protein
MKGVAIVLLLATAVHGAVHQENPVTKVVELIQELKAKIEADGKAEQKVYDKFACWCEKTTARKASAIEEAKTSIEELSEKVLNLKGKTATLKAEIAQLEKDISGNIEGTKEATTIREKETADYNKERSDLEQAIGALERAIGILTGAGEKPASALQQAQILSVANGVRSALRFAPSEFGGDDRKEVEKFVRDPMSFIPHPIDAAKKASLVAAKQVVQIHQKSKFDPKGVYDDEKKDMSSALDALDSSIGRYAQYTNAGSADTQTDDKQMVEDFVKDPTENHPKQSLAEVKNPFGDYAPASGAIQGMLKGMYDSMTSDLESKNADQAIKQKQFEELTATKNAELKTLKATLEKKKETLGEDTKTMTDSEVERDETQAQLKADEKFFEETKSACKTKADDWAERSRLRTEELAGINKAIEILTSDEAQATFGRATSMLLQSSQKTITKSASPRRDEAARVLKIVAKKHHSLRMSAMAALIQSSTEGHFDAVISEVDKLIAELRAEEQDDIDLRDYCQDAENKVENEIEDLQHKATNIQGLIDRLNAKKKEIQGDIKKTESDIAATEDAMAEALSIRNSENEDFKAALKDDTDAVALLASAIDAMTSFSKNNKLGLLAKKEDPEYAVDPDKAPETFSEPYGGRSSEGGGITSILGYIKEDLENEIGVSKKAEAEAQKEFEEQRAAATEVLTDLKAKKTSLETMEAETDEKIADAGEDKAEVLTRKENKQKYRESLKPKCDWMKGAFQERRDKRREEMNGLLESKASLAGKAQEEAQAGIKMFMQKS